VRVVLLLAGLTSGLTTTSACVETRLNRTLRTPEQVKALDQRSPYLKIHMKVGELYVLSKWRVDETARRVTGEGERFNLARDLVGSGAVTVSFDEVALLETNVLQRSPSAIALAVITGVSAGMTAFVTSPPRDR
jgi:hypothetical protein